MNFPIDDSCPLCDHISNTGRGGRCRPKCPDRCLDCEEILEEDGHCKLCEPTFEDLRKAIQLRYSVLESIRLDMTRRLESEVRFLTNIESQLERMEER